MNRWTRFVLAVLAVAHLYTFMHLPVLNNPNENVRIYMTHALLEDGTFAIGRRELDARGTPRDRGGPTAQWGYVNDKALVCDDPSENPPGCAGTLFAAKAPGTSLIGVPALAFIQTLGGDDLTLRSLTRGLRLLCVTLPTLLFALFFARFLTHHIRRPEIVCMILVAWGLGSMSFTYGQLFAGHQLTAIALFTAFMSWEGGRRRTGVSQRHADLLFGAALAAAVAFEYPALFPAIALALGFLRGRPGWLRTCTVGVGALPGVALVSLFHTRAFGAPWRTPYSSLENAGFVRDIAPGFLGLQLPQWEAFHGSFLAPFNGLFFFAPWMILVGVAVWMRARHRWTQEDARSAVTAALLVFGTYALFISCHSLWRGGWTLGPRYIAGCVPFAGFAIGVSLDQLGDRASRKMLPLLAGLVAASVIITGICSLVSQGFPFEFYNPFVELALPLFLEGHVAENLGNALGLTGLTSLAPLLLIVAATLLGVLLSSGNGVRGWARAVRVSTAIGIMVATLWFITGVEEPFNERKHSRAQWLRTHWVPEGQSPLSARRTELNALRRESNLPAAEWLELGNLEALAGNRATALARYRAAMEESPVHSSGR